MRHFMFVCFLMALLYWSPGHGRPEVELIRSHATVLRKEILSGSSKQDIGVSIEVLTSIRGRLTRISS